MKRIRIATIILLVMASSVQAQSAKTNDDLEQEIRKLDDAMAAAVLANDLPALEKLWADDLTVNAPTNQLRRGKKEVLALVRAGMLDYASIDRNVEAVLLYKDTAIVMGSETVRPRGKAPFAGQTVRRRFTNIWIRRNGQWQLTARHASIVSER
jgi:uncharacterized protein (TIGR02246 family)